MMDDLHSLQVANIELQAELRLVKQQLQQAQETIQFLAALCAQRNHVDPCQSDPSYLQKDHATFRATNSRIGLTSPSSRLSVESGYGTAVSSNDNSQKKERGVSFRAKANERAIDNSFDLLCGDSCDDGSNTPALRPKALEEVETGLLAQENLATAKTGNEYQQYSGASAAVAEQVRFSAIDHNHLLGLAVFLDEMDEQEQEKCFEDLGKRDSHHYPIEWKWYWEETVKPAFYAKMAAREPSEERTRSVTVQSSIIKAGDRGVKSKRPAEEGGAHRIFPQGTSELYPIEHASNAVCSPARKVSSPPESNDKCCGQAGSRPLDCVRIEQVSPVLESGKLPLQAISLHERMNDNFRDQSNLSAKVTWSTDSTYQNVGAGESQLRIDNVHSVLYRPGDPSPELRRTVLVSDLPPGTALIEVLHRILHLVPKTGYEIVLKAAFMETSKFNLRDGTAIDTNAALIVFAFADDAVKFVSACGAASLKLRSPSCGQDVVVKVGLLNTPTYPTSLDLVQLKLGNIARTVYLVDNGSLDPQGVAAEITVFGSKAERYTCVLNPMPYPLKASRNSERLLVLEYSNIAFAQAAKTILSDRRWYFSGLESGYLT